MQTMQKPAVVVGSGMSGLATAQVLSRHFRRVVVVEKDDPLGLHSKSALEVIKDKGGGRRGVPQYNHLQAFIANGLKTYDEIFGGRYIPALRKAGGRVVNVLSDFRYVSPSVGVLMRNTQSSEPVLAAFCTRHLLEVTARRFVQSNERVKLLHGATATGLLLEEQTQQQGAAVAGVSLSDGSLLPAALVVDCSGCNSRMPEWLTAAGYQPPRVSSVSADCGYACWLVKLSPAAEASLSQAGNEVQVIYLMAQPPERSIAYLWRVEGGAWMAGVGGFQGHHPPRQDSGLLQWAQQEVWHPVIGQLLAGSTQLGPASRFYGVGRSWRHYEELVLPERLLVMGDAVCSFNPVYGQGTSVAAVEASILDSLLAERRRPPHGASSGSLDLSGLSAEFQAAIEPVISSAFQVAASNDLKFTDAVSSGMFASGSSSRGGSSLLAELHSGLVERYMASVFDLATHDAVVNEALIRVMQYLDGPDALTTPAVAGRIALHQLAGLLGGVGRRPGGSSSSGSARQRVTADPSRFDLGLAAAAVQPPAAADGAVLRQGAAAAR